MKPRASPKYICVRNKDTQLQFLITGLYLRLTVLSQALTHPTASYYSYLAPDKPIPLRCNKYCSEIYHIISQELGIIAVHKNEKKSDSF